MSEDVETSPELKAFADAHPQIAELARKETAKLHAGDAENLVVTALGHCDPGVRSREAGVGTNRTRRH